MSTTSGWASEIGGHGVWIDAIDVVPVDHPHGYLSRTEPGGATEFWFLCTPCAKRLTPVQFAYGLKVGNILPAPEMARPPVCYECAIFKRLMVPLHESTRPT